MSLSKSIITFIEDLSFNVIIPTINRVFIVDNSWPHITKFKSEIFDNYMDTLSGQIFFTVHFDIFKKGTLNLTIIYNITHDIATQNTFTNIIINNIKGKSDYTTLFILDNIINVFNELSANIISIPDVSVFFE